MDANILILYEGRWRDASVTSRNGLNTRKGKVARALDALAAEAEGFTGRIDAGTIAVACALGHLMDLRFEGAYRKSHPALDRFMNWFEGEVPAFKKTKVHGLSRA